MGHSQGEGQANIGVRVPDDRNTIYHTDMEHSFETNIDEFINVLINSQRESTLTSMI